MSSWSNPNSVDGDKSIMAAKKRVAANKAKKAAKPYMDLKKWNEYYGPNGYLTKDLKVLGQKPPKKPTK